MLRFSLWTCLLLVLSAWGLGTDAHAQFRSGETSSRPDTLRSVAPSPLDEHRSLDGYVRDLNGRPMDVRFGDSGRYNPALSRGQKLLWGSVGLLVQSLCDTDEMKPLTAQPDFVLEPQERACIHCDRMEDRAWEAVLEGTFSSSP